MIPFKCDKSFWKILIISVIVASSLWADDDRVSFNPNRPLNHAYLLEIFSQARQEGNWSDWVESIGSQLIRDFIGPKADSQEWKNKLHLALILQWMGTPETDFAKLQLGDLRNAKKEKLTPEQLDELLTAASEKKLHPKPLQLIENILGDSTNIPHATPLGEQIPPEFLVRLFEITELRTMLLQTVQTYDYIPGVFRVLRETDQSNPSFLQQYPALAVALSVVYDRGLPDYWPHQQLDPIMNQAKWSHWKHLPSYFQRQAQSGNLLISPQQLSPSLLKHVVDIPIPLDEIDWAAFNLKTTLDSLEKNFSRVRYDQERINIKAYVWNLMPYTLDNILKSGGICVDQAYFACMSGKAQGVPTLYFQGQGSSGGHAWFGYYKPNKWIMDAGRYKEQRYVVGIAHDPQSWEPLNDHEIQFLTACSADSGNFIYAHNLIILGRLQLSEWNSSLLAKLADVASGACPDIPTIWWSLADLLESKNEKEILITHLKRMLLQFSNQPDTVQNIQKSLSIIDPTYSESVTSSKNARSDLLIRSRAETLLSMIKEEQWTEARAQYRKDLKTLERGGNLFFMLVRPYCLALKENGRTAEAMEALYYAENRLLADVYEGQSNLISDAIKHLRTQLEK